MHAEPLFSYAQCHRPLVSFFFPRAALSLQQLPLVVHPHKQRRRPRLQLAQQLLPPHFKPRVGVCVQRGDRPDTRLYVLLELCRGYIAVRNGDDIPGRGNISCDFGPGLVGQQEDNVIVVRATEPGAGAVESDVEAEVGFTSAVKYAAKDGTALFR